MYDPSGRPISFAVRTITARMTSPFFTLAFGIASLIDTTISSPTDAYLRRVPPNTRTQRTRRAPELSATSRMVSTWIIFCSFPSPHHCRFDDSLYAPAFFPTEGSRFHDRHLIPCATAIVRIMGFVFLPLTHVLFVDGVLDQPLDEYDDGPIHFIADDHSLSYFSMSWHLHCSPVPRRARSCWMVLSRAISCRRLRRRIGLSSCPVLFRSRRRKSSSASSRSFCRISSPVRSRISLARIHRPMALGKLRTD